MLYRPGLVGRLPCPQDWYFGSGPPTVNDDFSSGLAAGWTFSRASANATNCLYSDSPTAPAFITYAANAPRILPFGLLIEPPRTNYFLNSEAPPQSTQTVTLAVGTYTVWFHGTSGSSLFVMSASAAITPDNIVVNLGAPATFQVTVAGGVFVAVNNPTVTRVQVENGPNATSYVVSTATAQTRTEERLSKSYSPFGPSYGTYWVEYMWNGGTQFPPSAVSPAMVMSAGVGSFTNNASIDSIQIYNTSNTNTIVGNTTNAAGSTVSSAQLNVSRALGNVSRVALTVSPTRNQVAADYVLGTEATSSSRPNGFIVITLGSGPTPAPAFSGYIRGFRYWPVAMPDAELKECTAAGYYGGPPVFAYDGTVASQWRAWNFVRSASSGTITDALMTDPAGTAYNTYTSTAIPGTGQMRFTPKGLMMEAGRTTYIPNSNAVAASGATGSLGVGYYLATVRGSGSMQYTANTAVCVGLPGTATAGAPLSFQVTTAGTANYVCTGTVELAQLEFIGAALPPPGLDSVPTSFIRTTTVPVTRQGDGAYIPIGPWWNSAQGTYYIEVVMIHRQNGGVFVSADDDTANNRDYIGMTLDIPNNIGTVLGNTTAAGTNVGGLTTPPSQEPPARGVVLTYAYAVSSDRKRQFALNGVFGIGGSGSPDALPGNRPTATKFKLGIATTGVNFAVGMYVRKLRYYDYAMFDAQLAALTSAPSLDLSFLSGVLDPSITFTRASVATYFNATGTMQTAASGAPRFDYDPVTHAARGLLIEETRTNVQLNSGRVDMFTNSQSVTMTAGVGVAPDGSSNMARMAETAVNDLHFITEFFTVTASTVYTFSVFVGPSTSRYVGLAYSDNAAATGWAIYDLQTGTISQGPSVTGTAASAAATITRVPNGWRISITCSIGTSTSGRPSIFGANGPTVGLFPTYLGNPANNVTLWGAQLEAGAFPTSYIPTTAASVTRAADLATMPVGPWLNTPQGTLAADHMFPMTPPAGSFPSIAVLSDGTINNRILLLYSATSVRYRGTIYVGNVSVFDSLAGPAIAATVGATAKTAISWAAPTAQYAANGTIVLSGSTTVPTVTTLAFGNNGTGTTDSARYIRRIRYWPRVLSSTEMITATT